MSPLASRLKVGLIVNPHAGIGGPVGLKGSDGVYDEALAKGGVSRVAERVGVVIDAIDHERIDWVTVPGEMGADVLQQHGIAFQCLAMTFPPITTGIDTGRATQNLCEEGIDLLLFAGGDGTARDVADHFERVPVVLGIPAGVKMHSGVFANTPSSAAILVNKLAEGEILAIMPAEVRDIDEASFREGTVRTQFYGELPVPADLQYVQATKVGGREVEELVVQEIAADVIENMEAGVTYIMGSGSTINGILDAMGIEGTLLGIDVVRDGALVMKDVGEPALRALLNDGVEARIIVTAISGQGHILGRGNQQLSASVIEGVGIDNLMVVASKGKLAALEGRPLLVDTGDAALNAALSGMKPVITGYEDRVLYRVA